VTGWVILALYVLGWLLAVRPMMRRRMLRDVCDYCGMDWACGHAAAWRGRLVRGSRFERDGTDVAMALLGALWWPLWLAFLAVRWSALLAGRTVRRAVFSATPLTVPELERRLAEQQKEIDRLGAEIGEG